MGDNRERIAFATAIGRHINNIYAEGELDRESTCAKFAYVLETRERSYEIAYYNLDVIISVGYRVKSQRGVQFRQWATKRIHEYIVKGFTLDDERKKQYRMQERNLLHFFLLESLCGNRKRVSYRPVLLWPTRPERNCLLVRL